MSFILPFLSLSLTRSQPYHRIKLMLIGDSNVGKTSLLLNLTKKGKVSRFKEVEKGLNKLPLSTVGVDLGDWEYSPQSLRLKPVTFMTWDFGGQIEYYATHQCFLTQRSLYIIVWNAQEREKGLERIRPWLDNIGVRTIHMYIYFISFMCISHICVCLFLICIACACIYIYVCILCICTCTCSSFTLSPFTFMCVHVHVVFLFFISSCISVFISMCVESYTKCSSDCSSHSP